MLGFTSLPEFLLATLIVAIGSALQSSVGFGFALMSAPILAFVDPRLVPGPLILAVTLLLVLTAVREHQSMDLTGIGWVLFGRVPGTVLAIVLLDAMSERGITIGLGLLVLLAVVISLLRVALPRTPPLLMIAGLISGLMGTSSGLGGPAVAVLYQNEPGERVRSTLAGYFLIGAVMSLAALAYAGRMGRAEATLSLGLLARHRRRLLVVEADVGLARSGSHPHRGAARRRRRRRSLRLARLGLSARAGTFSANSAFFCSIRYRPDRETYGHSFGCRPRRSARFLQRTNRQRRRGERAGTRGHGRKPREKIAKSTGKRANRNPANRKATRRNPPKPRRLSDTAGRSACAPASSPATA